MVLPVCGKTSQVEYTLGDIYVIRNGPAELDICVSSNNMVKRCVAAGCSNTHGDGISLISFPRNLSLRAQWNKQVQKPCVDWRDAIDYSVFCSEHFTNDCFNEGSIIAAPFGTQKRRHLKPDAIPMIFNRPAATTASGGSLQEGPSVGYIRAAVTRDESTPVERRM